MNRNLGLVGRLALACSLAAVCASALPAQTPRNSPGDSAAAAGINRLATILATKQLRVCAWARPGGVMFRDRLSGEMQGMDAELAGELAHDLGVSLRFVDMDWRNVPDQLEHDRCDVAMGSIGITTDLAPRVRFTRPYIKSDHYMVVSQFAPVKVWSDLDEPSVSVAVRTNSIMETIARRHLRRAHIVVIAPPYTPDGELESGRADGYLANFSMARYALSHIPGVRVIAPDKPFEVIAYAFAARPGDDAWVARLDAFLDAVKHDGRLEKIARRWGYEDLILKD